MLFKDLTPFARILAINGILNVLSPQLLQTWLWILAYGESPIQTEKIRQSMGVTKRTFRIRLKSLSYRKLQGRSLLVRKDKNGASKGKFKRSIYLLPDDLELSAEVEVPQETDAGTDAPISEQSEVDESTATPTESDRSKGNLTTIDSPDSVQNGKFDDHSNVVSYNNKTTYNNLEVVRSKLLEEGILPTSVEELLRDYPLERIQKQLEYLPYRKNVRDKAAVLYLAIKGDWSAPMEYVSLKDKGAKVESDRYEQERKAEAQRRREDLEQKIQEIKSKLPKDELDEIAKEAERIVRLRMKDKWPKEKPVPGMFVKAEVNRLIGNKYLGLSTPDLLPKDVTNNNYDQTHI